MMRSIATGEDIDRVVVAVSLEPQMLDPTSGKFNPINYPVLSNMFDALVGVGNTGRPDMGKGVAESWTVSPQRPGYRSTQDPAGVILQAARSY
ncbi:MAG: hypothetical protein GX113_06695 [Actinobacteria bacterium]|jgi:hypothetical protein|nr:hypothetical protein [Actinomycetota bacterium]